MEPIFLRDIPPDEPETSRSAETIRQLPTYMTAMNLSSRPDSPRLSPPTSPHSEPLSPSGESVSSLPSVSSSFLLSSVPGSPPHTGLGLHHGHELGDSSLIIPSLTLPSAVRRPTPYGQTLGDLRLLILGHEGSGAEGVAQVFADLEGCDDIVEVSDWETLEADAGAKILKLSTDWIEHRDAHGLEKHEPSRNVEVVLLQDYAPNSDVDELLRSVLQIVHGPFKSLDSVLNPEQSPNGLLASLLASSTSPLYTALVLIPSHHLLPLEERLVAELSTHIPVILLPSQTSSSSRTAPLHHHSPYSRRASLQGLHATHTSLPQSAKLSPLRPHSVHALRTALLRTPDALSSLRADAADRFMRWREVERAVGHVLAGTSPPPEVERTPVVSPDNPSRQHGHPPAHATQRWDKARWEAEWEGALATDVAKTLRARRGKGPQRRQTITVSRPGRPRMSPVCTDVGIGTEEREEDRAQASFDPLHLPSLIAFSLSLLGPLKARIARVFTRENAAGVVRAEGGQDGPTGDGVHWALVGAFCAGVGVGIVLSHDF